MPQNDLLRIRENPRKQELVVSLIVKVCKDKMKSAKHSKMRVLRLLKAKAQSDGRMQKTSHSGKPYSTSNR